MADDLGGKINSVTSYWHKDGRKVSYITLDNDGSSIFFNKDGILPTPKKKAIKDEDVVLMEGFDRERITYLRGNRLAPLGLNVIASTDFHPSSSDLVYKHPRFDLIINKTDPDDVRVIDPRTGFSFRYTSTDIINFSIDHTGAP